MTELKTQFDYLIQPLAKENPRLYDALHLVMGGLQNLENQINPIQTQLIDLGGLQPPPGSPPYNFVATQLPDSIKLSWNNDDTKAVLFEIREGLVWETADFIVKTPSLTASLNPVVYGSYQYLIKSLNSDGVYSVDSTAVTLLISPGITTPVVTAQVIDNNVLLRWTDPFYTPGMFRTTYYNIYKNSVLWGTSAGNFAALYETTAGSYTYGVEAVDIAGNASLRGLVTATVNQPPDFELFHSWLSELRVVDPAPAGGFQVLAAVFVNAVRTLDGKLFVILDTTETWLQNYTNAGFGRPWTNDDDAIANAQPYYSQPGSSTGSYKETLDYGGTINNVIVNIDWTEEILSGNVVVSVQTEVSTDNITYSSPVNGTSAFYPSFRYLRVTLNFTGGPGALKLISALRIALDVKREVDSGEVIALSTDAAGTVVTFAKAFKDVDSITLAVKALEQVTAIYDFVDIPNPTTFKVMAFDGAGNRITYPMSWKARGIV